MTGGCVVCGAFGSAHFKGCRLSGRGMSLGGVPRRNETEAEVWRRLRDRVTAGRCVWPGCGVSSNVHAHHVETVQEVFARGGTWADADRPSNVVALCPAHHGRVHDAVSIELARTLGLRK